MIGKRLALGFSTLCAVGLFVLMVTGFTVDRIVASEDKPIDIKKLNAAGQEAEKRQNAQAQVLDELVDMGKFSGDKFDQVIALNNSSSNKVSAAFFEYSYCVSKVDNSYCERAARDIKEGNEDMDLIDEMMRKTQEISL